MSQDWTGKLAGGIAGARPALPDAPKCRGIRPAISRGLLKSARWLMKTARRIDPELAPGEADFAKRGGQAAAKFVQEFVAILDRQREQDQGK